MGLPLNKNYHASNIRDNESYLHTSISKGNPYQPKPESLKHGSLKGKTEILLSDGKSRIFVTPGHNIERAVDR
jgi:hypothetical protein